VGSPSARQSLFLLSAAAVALLVGLLFASGAAARLPAMVSALIHGNLGSLREHLRALGAAGVAALVTLVLIHTVLPFPAEPLEAAAGFALGLAVALPVLELSFVISALLAYLIGARLGRPVARGVIGSRRLDRAEQVIDRGGARALLALRLFPLVPFSPVFIACGLGRVPVPRYTWTTAAGILPEMAAVTYIGARLRSFSLTDPAIWVPLATVLILVVLGPGLLRSSRGRTR
jgi:uncharacterized membrane protein YdjX (TVP38/TMEM64 family)